MKRAASMLLPLCRLGLACCLLLGLPAQARQPLELFGRVSDADTGEPLPYAMLRIEHTSLGTISNDSGTFLLRYDPALGHGALVVSMVGYQSWKGPLPALPLASPAEILLRPQPIELREVEVVGRALSAQEIMEEALARLPDNYPSEPFLLHAFFRDVKLEEGQCVFLMEAATRIYDRNYHRAPRVQRDLLERVAIDEIRSTHHYGSNRAWIRALRRENAIKELLAENAVRYQSGVFDLERGFRYRKEAPVQLDSQLLFVVSVEDFPDTRIYIDAQTFGVLRVEHRSAKPILLSSGREAERWATAFELQFEFQRIGGKLYLKYMASRAVYEERRPRTGERLHHSELRLSMLVNQVETEPASPPPGRLAMNKHRHLEAQLKSYNEAFWARYNVIRENPLDSALLRDLREKAPDPFLKP